VCQAGSLGCARAERQAKRLIAPNGDFKPTTNGERLDLAEFCQIKKLTPGQTHKMTFCAEVTIWRVQFVE
jgi:hypothetical protein